MKPLQQNSTGHITPESSPLEVPPEHAPIQDPLTEVPAPPSKEGLNQLGHLTAIDKKLCEMREFTKMLHRRLSAKDRRDYLIKEWKATALILDRMFFIFYLLFIFSCLVVILPMLTYTKLVENSMLKIAKGEV